MTTNGYFNSLPFIGAMEIVKNIPELRLRVKEAKKNGKTVGFVPTMGFLHEGHLSLVRRAAKDNCETVVSIFVNPTQFGPNEDYDAYPRDLDRDEALLNEEGVNYLFFPSVEEMYPDGFSSAVKVTGLTDGLCGAKRPGHFEGVTTIVAKLLSIVAPDNIYMGMKDYQQFKVVSRMVKDLNIPCKVNGVEIIREHDGLAMSSRNVLLQNGERKSALSLYNSFHVVQKLIDQGIVSSDAVIREIAAYIRSHENTRVDYIEFVDTETLKPVKSLTGTFICMLAVYIGSVRLIDNMVFNF